MRRFARRLSQIARLNVSDKDLPSVVLTRPSQASIFQFDDDASYFRNLGLKTSPTPAPPVNPSYLSAPSLIAKRNKGSGNGSTTDLSDKDSMSVASMSGDLSSLASMGQYSMGPVLDEAEVHRRANSEMFARTVRFLSIMYGLLLIIVGAMCTIFNMNARENYARDVFFILLSLVGFSWLAFLHYDILKYKKWALAYVKPMVEARFGRESEDEDDEGGGGGEEGPIETISGGGRGGNVDAYDSVSLNTAMIFDYVGRQTPRRRRRKTEADSVSMTSYGGAAGTSKGGSTGKNSIETGYRFFQGKHSNDFYLKTGMIIFCFGSIMHLGIGTVQQGYFFLHHDAGCQEPLKLATCIIRVIFSFYQLFIAFKYSNIIINRYKNAARFALMHLLGTAICKWLDTIVDEVIEDYVDRRLSEHAQTTNSSFGDSDALAGLLEEYSGPFRDHLLHSANCSHMAIVSSDSMSALPYLYPFTIEFNVAIASIWYMIWTNIGKVNDSSLFHGNESTRLDDEDEEDEESGFGDGVGLSLNVDCHSSNRGLFLGLAFLLVIIITIVIFFSTIKKDVYAHFSVAIYSLQIAVLTICSFIVIPLAYFKIQKLDVIRSGHRDNAFTIMDDILVLIPVPFYLIHYSLGIIANLADSHEPPFERSNNLLLAAVDLLTIAQVLLQSPFIVDGLRRCANRSSVRRHKPGRELLIFALILNVTLWILNTFELKSVEVYHAPYHYFGEFTAMILSHATLPIMLFYRFHSSVCLSNIWKYAYLKDE